MATYRLEAKVISRAKGRSATASAAYRSGGVIADERTGELYDYSAKRGVLHSEIMAPPNTPAWMLDREELWNAVERVEQRRDAQLARDFLLSLPYELTHEQRVEVTRDFLREEIVSRGMIADFSIHAPDRRSDPRNHHAHVMVTMRDLTAGGFGMKNREWNRTALLEHWRERWGNVVNRHLERHGHEARVDHRSLADQGIDREPEPKQGPVATEMERGGRQSHAGDDRRAVKERNAEREALARAGEEIDRELWGELILLDPNRPRGSAFEDVREAREGEGNTRRIRPTYGESDGGLVAQQADAMRRFRRNSEALERRRVEQNAEQQVRDDGNPSSALDITTNIPEVSAGSEEREPMSSKYDSLRAEQRKAEAAHEQERAAETAKAQSDAQSLQQAQPVQPKVWPMEQSLPNQGAAAHDLVKARHEHRIEQLRAKDGANPQEPVRDDQSSDLGKQPPEKQLRFSEDRQLDTPDRSKAGEEQAKGAPSQDEPGKRELRFSEDRHLDTPDRSQSGDEQAKSAASQDEPGKRELRFSEDRQLDTPEHSTSLDENAKAEITQPESGKRELRFSEDRQIDTPDRSLEGNEPAKGDVSQDEPGKRELRFSEDRESNNPDRASLKREQSQSESSPGESGERNENDKGEKQLRFSEDRNRGPDLER